MKNWHAPPPGSKSGIADYAERLGAALGSCPVPVYHIGNNILHRAIYERALREPGVVLLHDAVLQHLHLSCLSEAEYQAEFVYNYGEWRRDLAQRLYRNRANSGADPVYFRYPMLRRLAESARAMIVHNPEAADLVMRHAPDTKLYELPHYVESEPGIGADQVADWRTRHNVAPHECLFGVFGFLRETKRLHVILRATRATGSRLLIQGEFASGSTLSRALGLPDGRVIRVGYLAEDPFHVAASACDVSVNLRYPTAGETSGIGLRLMSMGKPLVVTESRAWGRFPPGSLYGIPCDASESEHLIGCIGWMGRNPVARREIGRRARAHLLAHHQIDQVAAQLRRWLASV